ncbi:glutamate synthase large subunit [Hydrogenobaculum acidophilum]
MQEKDSCGVGFICDISGQKSNKIVKYGIEAVKNLTHRGAIGADGKTGDGAGILIQIPHKFFKKEIERLGFEISSIDNLGVGVLFLKNNDTSKVEEIAKRMGFKVIGFRDVPVDKSALGKSALETMPVIKHMLLDLEGIENKELALYFLRKSLKKELKIYIPSLSSKTIVYKGMFVAYQIDHFYKDLEDETIESSICLFHQRYSTNTFPNWNLAQPFRYLAHNGEINTINGNRNWMMAIQSELYHKLLEDKIKLIKPIVEYDESDSGSLDKVFELLVLTEYPVEHAINMLIPPAWENDYTLDDDIRAFFEYKSLLMKPWDGPAAIVFTDGVKVGAHLDRNGLRPSRYIITKDNIVILGSEVGMVNIDPQDIKESERLSPGDTLLIDTHTKSLKTTEEILKDISKKNPYKKWIEENLVKLENLIEEKSLEDEHLDKDKLTRLQAYFGYTTEELKNQIDYMAKEAKEYTFSMGDDTPLPPLNEKPVLMFRYFKQRFAQVTNPPIDSIRERFVMSLKMNLGHKRNFLVETKEHARRFQIDSPVLLPYHMKTIENQKHFKVKRISLCYPKHRSDNIQALQDLKGFERVSDILMDAVYEGIPIIDLKIGLEVLTHLVEQAVKDGADIIILSDKDVDEKNVAIPSLLGVSASVRHLAKLGLSQKVSFIVETGEVRDTHALACLIGYGASAVYPYLLYETLYHNYRENYEQAIMNYKKALEDGILKIMAKMGIATLNSYQGAEIFDSVCLNKDFVEEYFTGTPVTLEADGIEQIEESILKRHDFAFNSEKPTLDYGGDLRFRKGGIYHAWSPHVVRALHKYLETLDYNDYLEFSRIANEEHPTFIHHLLDYKKSKSPIPIEEVEPEEEILKRFVTGAMSLGALSPEAHEVLALATNMLGMKSNSGEGGEDPERYFTDKNSAIKQVASGRFGVTPTYLASAKDIEIKIAQGAKPGEGGQLPGKKVSPYIAKIRYSQEGITLISPPPHHDIYSIEDLAQLINDLKKANPEARISVKLVSESGIGTIASGVAKAYADIIQVSGTEGGTGASPISSIKNAGNYWEIGLYDTVKTLMENNLRERVSVRVDGGFRTAKDVIIGAILGAEEFGFGTAAMIAEGCVMARQCHLNTCPTGVATQDAKLRAKFSGTKEGVAAYFRALAREVREILASMGYKSLNDIIGRLELLEPKPSRLKLEVFTKGYPKDAKRFRTFERNNNPEKSLNDFIAKELEEFIKSQTPVERHYKITNIDRSVGATISYYTAIYHKDKGLPPNTINLYFEGVAGQSFGAFNHKGINLFLKGMANDYVGKGMHGGIIAIKPFFSTDKNFVLAGNTILYGATGGELYIAGRVGERFAVRNSGAKAVVEGVGHHALEYMTGGIVINIGDFGYNVGAGMTGGMAYFYDKEGILEKHINTSYVLVQDVAEEDKEIISSMLEAHISYTDSPLAKKILEEGFGAFRKIMPIEACVRSESSDECVQKV